MHVEGEKGDIGWCREDKHNGGNAADYAYDEGCNHCHPVAAKGCLLILSDVFHSIEALGKTGHELGLVVEMWCLGEEKLLQSFIFHHSFSFSFSLSRPRESCFLTASSLVSVIMAISLILYPLR